MQLLRCVCSYVQPDEGACARTDEFACRLVHPNVHTWSLSKEAMPHLRWVRDLSPNWGGGESGVLKYCDRRWGGGLIMPLWQFPTPIRHHHDVAGWYMKLRHLSGFNRKQGM